MYGGNFGLQLKGVFKISKHTPRRCKEECGSAVWLVVDQMEHCMANMVWGLDRAHCDLWTNLFPDLVQHRHKILLIIIIIRLFLYPALQT